MTLYRNRFRIESARLSEWDYSSAGYYFVTIVTHGRKELFGRVNNDLLELNKFGEIVLTCWQELPIHSRELALDKFVIMPNHLHGIIRIIENKPESHKSGNIGGFRRDVACNVSIETQSGPDADTKIGSKTNRTKTPAINFDKMAVISPLPSSISVAIRSFKSATSKKIHASGFAGIVWQPRFHDHIIRDNRELYWIQKYIEENPAQWDADSENPSVTPGG